MIALRTFRLVFAGLASAPLLIACDSSSTGGSSRNGGDSIERISCELSTRTPRVYNFCEFSFHVFMANRGKYYGKKVSFHAFFQVGPRNAVAAAIPISLENAEFSEMIFARDYRAEEFASELKPGVTYRGRLLGELAPAELSGKPHHAAVLVSPYIFHAYEVDPADAGESR